MVAGLFDLVAMLVVAVVVGLVGEAYFVASAPAITRIIIKRQRKKRMRF